MTPTTTADPRAVLEAVPAAMGRLHVTIRGAVQGVGFRPFLYRLARELQLTGWVCNSAQGVVLEAEGRRDQLAQLLTRLRRAPPPRAAIHQLEPRWVPPAGDATFEIRTSEGGAATACLLPDIATCDACLAELYDPADRRYRYPFTNCINCGPRYSITQALPYDRPRTTMAGFIMCAACRAEYDDPADRRFHAQPNACPSCGPRLAFWDARGDAVAAGHEALLRAADAIRRGAIVAVKGLGGFHLLVDAANEEAVRLLRARKGREAKPLALMYPSLAAVRGHCGLSALEERLLTAPEAPIVLLRRRVPTTHRPVPLAPSVAPDNPYLGAMLPYTPLHHLLLEELGRPVVATSGNRSDEPLCIDEQDALRRLGGIADGFLVHDRPIAHPVDDSVVRVVAGRELLLRCGRGYAPLSLHGEASLPHLLAMGGQLKNTVALAVGRETFVSPHVGDLDTAEAYAALQRTVAQFRALYETPLAAIACDLHPDYRSTQYARQAGARVISVQHHYAHVLSCMAEHGLEAPVLGVAWDGTGYGLDGTIWGGEWLRVTDEGFVRAAHWRTFPLPGGEAAVREPRRAALGLLYECFGAAAFNRGPLAPVDACTPQELTVFHTMLARGVNTPRTSSAGRLFDAVAALVGLRQRNRFEGEAAMALEWALDGVDTGEDYPLRITDSQPPASPAPCPLPLAPLIVDWAPMVEAILEDLRRRLPVGVIAAKFHNALVEAIVLVARRVGEPRVVLTGGCFQNRYLTERAVRRLEAAGVQPQWHRRVPPNDGGIALGQLMAAARQLRKG